MKRRTFLKAAGFSAAGLLVAGFAGYSVFPVIPKRPAPDAEAAAGWISYKDGEYLLQLPRIEMGQNIATALKQIACDELGVGWQKVSVRLHDTAKMERVRATVGSESVMAFGVPLAQACAALREAIETGKTEGKVAVEERPFSELRAFSGGGNYVGRTVDLEQAEGIVTGQATYAADIRLPMMVYGRVLFPPTLPELPSEPVTFDRAAASAQPGFVDIVEDDLLTLGVNRGIGIVARTPSALDRIEEVLALEWSRPEMVTQTTIDDMIDPQFAFSNGATHKIIRETGDIQTGEGTTDLRIDIPLAAHASIETRACVADFRPDASLAMWVGNQDAYFVRDKISRRMGITADKISVQSMRVGGAFGGKTICSVEMEAAVLSRAVRRPVKVQWTRAQEFSQGFHRPPSRHHIRSNTGNGLLKSWHHNFVSSHILFTNAAVPNWMQGATDLFVGDPGVARGADLDYRAENLRIEYGLQRLPVFTGPWRGLGAGPNLLAIESAIDESAIAAGSDPLTFRLANISHPRLRRVLERVAILAGWEGPSPKIIGGRRHGRGMACGIYKGMSYAATIADVSVDSDGTITVDRFYCTHDCGQVINPDQVRAQCEGNLVWGLGTVLNERLPIVESAISARDFVDSPIPTMSQMPTIGIELVDEGDPPSGAGETVIVSAMGAVANAVRAATGRRPVTFPLDAEDFAA